MPTIQELEREDPIQLAVRCQRVAEDPANFTAAGAEEAFKLKLEWVKLAGAHAGSAKEHDAIEAQMLALNHLAALLPVARLFNLWRAVG